MALQPKQPKDWALNPWAFGLMAEVEWLPVPEGEDRGAAVARASRRAATLQHGIAAAAQQRLLSCGYKDLTALARTGVGLSYSQLHKIMHGAAPMSLRHVAALEERLGPLLVITLSDAG